LLFYALAQAGRAILAAHAPQAWEVHGHGLSVRIERNTSAIRRSLLQAMVYSKLSQTPPTLGR
jgi:hypothetical protein